MKNPIFRFWLILGLVFILSAELKAGTKIQSGLVVDLYGDVVAVSDQKTRKLYKGSRVFESDQINTGDKSRLKIRFFDGAEMILGANTEFLIENYRYDDAKKEGNSAVKVIKGFFHSISGQIAKHRPERFKVRTVMAVIGVKGTEFWGGFWDGGKFEVALLDGKGVVISNQAGTVEINNIGWGTTLISDSIAPTNPIPWGEEKLKRAAETVTWNP